MKKLRYFLPIIGLLFFTSCDNDDSNEIIDETLALDQGQIEIIENTDDKTFIFGLRPGIYGPTNVDISKSVTYKYIPPSHILSQIPEENRRYSVAIVYDSDPGNPGGFGIAMGSNTMVPSNTVTLKFPAHYINLTHWEWRIKYVVRHSNYSDFPVQDITYKTIYFE